MKRQSRNGLLALALLFAAVAPGSPSPNQQPTQGTDSATVMRGSIVMGVDTLGRFLAALDEAPQDGLVDRYFLFTAETRLTPAWSTLEESARVVHTNQSLSIESGTNVALSIRDARAPALQALFANTRGVELVHSSGGKNENKRQLLDVDVFDIADWPDTYEIDLLASVGGDLSTFDPLTWDASALAAKRPCDDSYCSGGGCPSYSCNVGGCDGTPSSCGVSCGGPPVYSCCWCEPIPIEAGPAKCRCYVCPSCWP